MEAKAEAEKAARVAWNELSPLYGPLFCIDFRKRELNSVHPTSQEIKVIMSFIANESHDDAMSRIRAATVLRAQVHALEPFSASQLFSDQLHTAEHNMEFSVASQDHQGA